MHSENKKTNVITIRLPSIKKQIPLFVLFRALGIESDKSIIEHCLLNLEKYHTYIDLFIPSIHDANKIFTQEVALKYIATLTKGKTVPHALEILTNYFLPHVGEMNFIDKAFCFVLCSLQMSPVPKTKENAVHLWFPWFLWVMFDGF